MADTVDVPQIGKVDRKWLYAGGAVVAGIVGYAYWARSRSRSVFDPNAIDPMTGLPYSASMSTGPYVNPNPRASGSDTVDNQSGQILTNQQWSAAVTESLINVGYDAGFVASVLGKYLSKQPLTSDEANMVRVAWAYQGKPPEGPDTIVMQTGGGSTPGTPAPPPPPPPPPPPAPPPPPPPAQRTFTVQSWPQQGSTLSGIAQIVYGNAGLWPNIYNRNSDVIEAAARARGNASSNNGNLIYADTVLVIP